MLKLSEAVVHYTNVCLVSDKGSWPITEAVGSNAVAAAFLTELKHPIESAGSCSRFLGSGEQLSRDEAGLYLIA